MSQCVASRRIVTSAVLIGYFHYDEVNTVGQKNSLLSLNLYSHLFITLVFWCFVFLLLILCCGGVTMVKTVPSNITLLAVHSPCYYGAAQTSLLGGNQSKSKTVTFPEVEKLICVPK